MTTEDAVRLARIYVHSENLIERRGIEIQVEQTTPENQQTFEEWIWLYAVLLCKTVCHTANA